MSTNRGHLTNIIFSAQIMAKKAKISHYMRRRNGAIFWWISGLTDSLRGGKSREA